MSRKHEIKEKKPVRTFLVWTNPFTYALGLPIFIGIVLAAMADGLAKKTKKIIKGLDI